MCNLTITLLFLVQWELTTVSNWRCFKAKLKVVTAIEVVSVINFSEASGWVAASLLMTEGKLGSTH